jgi:hypothetical protein
VRRQSLKIALIYVQVSFCSAASASIFPNCHCGLGVSSMCISQAKIPARSLSLFLAIAAAGLSAYRQGQGDRIIPLSKESHHHLAFHNPYVNIYEVVVLPHDTVELHRHTADAISVMLDDADVTVRSPGKPDVHSRLSAGQIRLQPAGYVHSTTIDSGPYRNITVELIQPQTEARNRCATVLADKPQNCVDGPQSSHAGYSAHPQFETDQTRIVVYRIASHGSIPLSALGAPGLVIALSPVSRWSSEGSMTLKSGSFIWTENPGARDVIRNETPEEAVLASFAFNR